MNKIEILIELQSLYLHLFIYLFIIFLLYLHSCVWSAEFVGRKKLTETSKLRSTEN